MARELLTPHQPLGIENNVRLPSLRSDVIVSRADVRVVRHWRDAYVEVADQGRIGPATDRDRRGPRGSPPREVMQPSPASGAGRTLPDQPALVAGVALGIGLLYVRRMERTFADVA